MSLKKVEQVKKDRCFKLADLIIYGVVILLAAALFIAFFAVRDDSPLRGVRIRVDNAAVYEYSFADGSGGALTEDGTVSVEENGGIIEVTVRAYGGYNVIVIDVAARTARVREADCPGGDCVYTELNRTEISSNNSPPVYCPPHRLVVEPLGYSPSYDDPHIKI